MFVVPDHGRLHRGAPGDRRHDRSRASWSPLDDRVTKVAVLPYGDAIGAGKFGTVKSAQARSTALAQRRHPRRSRPARHARPRAHAAQAREDRARGAAAAQDDPGDRRRPRSRRRSRARHAGSASARTRTASASTRSRTRRTDTRRPLLALGELSRQSLGHVPLAAARQGGLVGAGVPAAPRRDPEAVRADVLPVRRRRSDRQEAQDRDRRARRGDVERDQASPQPTAAGEACDRRTARATSARCPRSTAGAASSAGSC